MNRYMQIQLNHSIDSMASSSWWFTIINNALHYRSTEQLQPVGVSYVTPDEDREGFVTVVFTGEELKISCPIEDYQAVDTHFAELNAKGPVSRRKFCLTLQKLLNRLIKVVVPTAYDAEIGSGSDQEESSAEPAKAEKYKYKHKSFKDELQLMRSLHPGTKNTARSEFLNPKDKAWRKQSALALRFNGSSAEFGGNFREQIYCATLPECCFLQLMDIFSSFDVGLIQSEKKTPVIKAGLFTSFVGCKEEPKIHRLLNTLSMGMITLEEFRKEAKKLKESPVETVESLKKEVRRLEEENTSLKLTVDALKKQLRTDKEVDVYEFESTPEKNTPYKRIQRTIVADVHDNPTKKQRRLDRENELNEIMQELRQEEVQVIEQQPMEVEVQNTEQQPAQLTETPDVVYSKGEKVMAEWDSEWYEAVIVRVNKTKGYYIRYFDGVKATVSAERLKKL